MLGSPHPSPHPLMAQGPGAAARSWEDQIPSPRRIVVSWLKIGLQAARPQGEPAIVEGRGGVHSREGHSPELSASSCCEVQRRGLGRVVPGRL